MIDKAFDRYLRRGIPLDASPDRSFERKFNPYHDPADGRFTFAPGHGSLAPRPQRVTVGSGVSAGRRAAAIVRSSGDRSVAAARALGRARIGDLSAKYESGGGGDPGAVSSGLNDPGGVSYGKHQLSSRKGDVARFMRSPEAARWAAEFSGLAPGTPEFSARWKQVAARDRDAFGAAQDLYSNNNYYDEVVGRVLRRTGLNLDGGSLAIRQVTFSVAVQHGRASEILSIAIARTDERHRRSDAAYQRALINEIYDRRTEYVVSQRDSARRKHRLGEAQIFDNVVRNRYPDERRDALSALDARN